MGNDTERLTLEECKQMEVCEKVVEKQCKDCAYWCRMAWRMLPENTPCLNFRNAIPGLQEVEIENAVLTTNNRYLLEELDRVEKELAKHGE